MECLNKLYKLNSQIFSYFEGIDILEENLPDKDMMDGIELNMYMVGHKFLLDSAPDLDIYIKENKSKVIKK